jgi:ERCC4-type nuclease
VFGPPIRTDHFGSSTTRIATLKESDYSASVDDSTALSIRLERKSLADLYGCFGQHRERFVAELARLRTYDYRALIIEAALDDIIDGYEHSRVSPRAALGSLCAWAVRYGPAVWSGGDHSSAAAIAQWLLEAFAIGVLHRTPWHSTNRAHPRRAGYRIRRYGQIANSKS